jgi:multisubunit Na+/H+ antiporter MnhE subunit
MHGVSDGVLAFVANMTALTPGTMTIEIRRDPPVFYVHILQLDDVEHVRAEVRKLERLAIEAFATPQAVAALHASSDTDGRAAGPLR